MSKNEKKELIYRVLTKFVEEEHGHLPESIKKEMLEEIYKKAIEEDIFDTTYQLCKEKEDLANMAKSLGIKTGRLVIDSGYDKYDGKESLLIKY